MKTLHNLFLASILFSANLCLGQGTSTAKDLVNQGIELHDKGKYDEAIAKYQEAIKLDPANTNAQYEIAYSLSASGKNKEAIPYLEKLIKINPKSGGAFDLLGNIYDDDNQSDKAIDYYKQGIIAEPEYQRLHFNLAITYLRQKKFTEAETAAINAIKLDPKHASSQRAYAIATYNDKKRSNSLVAWCGFLLLEPQSQRSKEAYQYIQKILNYGIKKTSENAVTLTVSDSDLNNDNLLLQTTILAATSDKMGLSVQDSISLELSSVFQSVGEYPDAKSQTFFKSFYADYFKALAQSGNMPAFTRYISLSAYNDDNRKWFKEHDKELKAFGDWVDSAKRTP